MTTTGEFINPGEPGREALPATAHEAAATCNLPGGAENVRESQRVTGLTTLTSGLAHGFNNIIAGILGSAEILRMDAPPGDPSHEFIQQIFVEGERAKAMLRQLKAFSQRVPGVRERFWPHVLLEDCVQELRSKAASTVTINAYFDPKCPAVFADKAAFREAVMTLCANATRTLPATAGKLSLKLEAARGEECGLGSLPRGSYVLFSLLDNGKGLGEAAIGRLFEPFASRDSEGGRFGMEMYAVQDFAHAHSGAIRAESSPGQGTLLKLWLPACD